MTRGKVVLVPFPFDDFSTIQRELGELSPQLQAEVSEKLRKLFSLD